MKVEYDDGLVVDWSDGELDRIIDIQNTPKQERAMRVEVRAVITGKHEGGDHPLAKLAREMWK